MSIPFLQIDGVGYVVLKVQSPLLQHMRVRAAFSDFVGVTQSEGRNENDGQRCFLYN